MILILNLAQTPIQHGTEIKQILQTSCSIHCYGYRIFDGWQTDIKIVTNTEAIG